MTAPSSATQRTRNSDRKYVYTHEANTGIWRNRVTGRELSAQKYMNILLPSTKILPVLQSTTTENILYRRMHVSACRKQGAHVLRGVSETHVLQLL